MNKYETYENRKKILWQRAVNGKGHTWYEQEIRKLAKELKI